MTIQHLRQFFVFVEVFCPPHYFGHRFINQKKILVLNLFQVVFYFDKNYKQEFYLYIYKPCSHLAIEIVLREAFSMKHKIAKTVYYAVWDVNICEIIQSRCLMVAVSYTCMVMTNYITFIFILVIMYAVYIAERQQHFSYIIICDEYFSNESSRSTHIYCGGKLNN